MKRRKWILQDHKPDADWAILENLLHIDEITQLSIVQHTVSAETFGPDCLPVGDISFIAEWIRKNYQKKMEPIEVPECLRKPEFLRRRYYFVEKKDLPFNSRQKYFIKNVSAPKAFNNALYNGAVPGWHVLPEGKYLVSEWMEFLSEFRIFVHHDRIIAIQPYSGMPLMFPNADKIREMVKVYRNDPERPGAYTMDIGVNRDRDGILHTVIIEVHPFASCGLYGFCSPEIPDMLEEGILYYTGQQKKRKHNNM